MRKLILPVFVGIVVYACGTSTTVIETKSDYWDYSNKSDKLSGGTRMIPIETASGTFNVWTKRMGNNPKMKVLLCIIRK